MDVSLMYVASYFVLRVCNRSLKLKAHTVAKGCKCGVEYSRGFAGGTVWY